MGLINKYKKSNGDAPGRSLKRSEEFSGIWGPSCSGNQNDIAQKMVIMVLAEINRDSKCEI